MFAHEVHLFVHLLDALHVGTSIVGELYLFAPTNMFGSPIEVAHVYGAGEAMDAAAQWIYSISNLTGGASRVDIVAPVVPYKNSVYAGGLGNAFCKINANSGVKQWCVDISVPVSFTIAGDYAFVVGTDSNLYAISVKNGDVFWRTSVEKQSAPMYENGIVSVGKQRINAENGKNIK